MRGDAEAVGSELDRGVLHPPTRSEPPHDRGWVMHRNRCAEAGCCLGMFCLAVAMISLAAHIAVEEYVYSSRPIIFPHSLSPFERGVATVIYVGQFVGFLLAVASWWLSLFGFNECNELRSRRGRIQAGIGLGCSMLFFAYILLSLVGGHPPQAGSF